MTQNGRGPVLYLAGLFSGALLVGLVFALARFARPAPIIIEPAAPMATPAPTAGPASLVVYVSGEVAAPGVYELPPDSRVAAAVEAAGGFSAAADRERLNLAQPLADGSHVTVPAVGATIVVPVVMPPDAGGSGAATPSSGPADRINVNQATLAELETLPGIGPALADSIIRYREENGPFLAIEELLDVSGIGPARLGAIQDLVTVD